MGNVYKDEAGHFTNKENNGGPCKHKRIAGGKYEYSEDGGKTWNAFEKREDYDAYETDEDERFDENNEDDFGFDEEDEAGSPYNEVDYNWVKDHIDDNPGIKAEQLTEDVKDKFGDINPEDEMEIRKIIDEEYNTEMTKAQEENAEKSVAAEENKEEEKYSDFIGEDGQVKPDKREDRDAFINKKWDEATKIITDAGMKDVALSYAGQLKNDYIEGKITKDELVDKYREHFKNQKDIVGETNKDGLEYDKTAAEKFKNAGFDVASEEEVNEVFGKKKPYNREERVKEYLKEQGFDDDYINKTLENMKKNMNIGQFWDRFFKDKEEK